MFRVQWYPTRRRPGVQGAWLRWLAALLAIVLAPAWGAADSSRFHPPHKDENGALRLTQVIGLGSRQDILSLQKDYPRLLASGIPDSALVDGSIGVGRVNCCGGMGEHTNDLCFYIPPGLAVEVGDIVELRMGRQSSKKDPGAVNVVTRIRQKHDATERAIRWEPPNERLWRRVLYADWMPAEGWSHKGGLTPTWFKRAEGDSAR